jgi:signal transduction histidine kinase
MVNLISNALKFTCKGYIKIKVDIEDSWAEDVMNNANDLFLSLNQSKGSNTLKVIFSVKDTGIGIKDEDHSKLFKMFGKIAQNDNVNPSGIGLGLTICNKILK